MVSPDYLVEEDGSGKIDSNSYWDVDSIVTYLSNKGVLDINNYNANQIARGAISSTAYIEKRFKRRYRGLRQSVDQSLGWPRIGAFDDDNFTIFGIPPQLTWAQAEYTIRACRLGVLAPDPLRTAPAADFSQPVPGLTPGTNKLTATANFADGEQIMIGQRIYTMQTVLTMVDGNILIGGTLVASLLNIMHAINDDGGVAGTDYFVTQADENVVATATLTQLLVEDMQPGANNVTTSTTAAHATWASATLTGYSNVPVNQDLILGPVRTKIEKVGPLEEETEYDGLSQLATINANTTRSAQTSMVNDFYIPEYPEADLWLEQLVRNPATGTRLIRGT